MKTTKMKNAVLLALVVAGCVTVAGAHYKVPKIEMNNPAEWKARIDQGTRNAVTYLKNHMVAQDNINCPGGSFMQSVGGWDDGCFTYDTAVSAVALIHAGELAPAHRLITQLKCLQDRYTDGLAGGKPGYFFTGYFCWDDIYEDHAEVGPIAWGALAALHYKVAVPSSHEFDVFIERSLSWLVSMQNLTGVTTVAKMCFEPTLTAAEKDGGLNHGLCYYKDASTWYHESWAGVEANFDAFALFRLFPKYRESAKLIWNVVGGKHSGFIASPAVWNVDHLNTGRNDISLHLDVDAWGYLVAKAAGITTLPNGDSIDALLAHATRAFYTPSISGSINSGAVKDYSGYDYNRWNPKLNAPELPDDVWFEGTAQMAVAQYISGSRGNAEISTMYRKLMDAVRDGQWLPNNVDSHECVARECPWNHWGPDGPNDCMCGGVSISLKGSHNSYWQFATAPGAAPTAWYILAALKKNPFDIYIPAARRIHA